MFYIMWLYHNKKTLKDHWSQMTITNVIKTKKFEILWELPKGGTEMQGEQMLLEKWRW